MGTETHRLQKEIKRLIKRLGWSQKRLARELQAMEEDDGCATNQEVKQYEERVKKHLNRPTVSSELLERYLQQIQEHEDFGSSTFSYRIATLMKSFQRSSFRGCGGFPRCLMNKTRRVA